MDTLVGFILSYQKEIYLVVTIALVVFLYGYVYHLYASQKKGVKDYEKYANLALNDNIDDELIEPRSNQKEKSK